MPTVALSPIIMFLAEFVELETPGIVAVLPIKILLLLFAFVSICGALFVPTAAAA